MATKSTKMRELGITEYADEIGISRQAVHKQIKNNNLPKGVSARRVSHSYIITIDTEKYVPTKKSNDR